jgi:hypothetical protein
MNIHILRQKSIFVHKKPVVKLNFAILFGSDELSEAKFVV